NSESEKQTLQEQYQLLQQQLQKKFFLKMTDCITLCLFFVIKKRNAELQASLKQSNDEDIKKWTSQKQQVKHLQIALKEIETQCLHSFDVWQETVVSLARSIERECSRQCAVVDTVKHLTRKVHSLTDQTTKIHNHNKQKMIVPFSLQIVELVTASSIPFVPKVKPITSDKAVMAYPSSFREREMVEMKDTSLVGAQEACLAPNLLSDVKETIHKVDSTNNGLLCQSVSETFRGQPFQDYNFNMHFRSEPRQPSFFRTKPKTWSAFDSDGESDKSALLANSSTQSIPKKQCQKQTYLQQLETLLHTTKQLMEESPEEKMIVQLLLSSKIQSIDSVKSGVPSEIFLVFL
ncbi:hypothetical protein RFI_25065, partial [Reticulomyxa filosa]